MNMWECVGTMSSGHGSDPECVSRFPYISERISNHQSTWKDYILRVSPGYSEVLLQLSFASQPNHPLFSLLPLTASPWATTFPFQVSSAWASSLWNVSPYNYQNLDSFVKSRRLSSCDLSLVIKVSVLPPFPQRNGSSWGVHSATISLWQSRFSVHWEKAYLPAPLNSKASVSVSVWPRPPAPHPASILHLSFSLPQVLLESSMSAEWASAPHMVRRTASNANNIQCSQQLWSRRNQDKMNAYEGKEVSPWQHIIRMPLLGKKIVLSHCPLICPWWENVNQQPSEKCLMQMCSEHFLTKWEVWYH